MGNINSTAPQTLRLASPNGSIWLLTISDDGALQVAPAAAPTAKKLVGAIGSSELADAVQQCLSDAVRSAA